MPKALPSFRYPSVSSLAVKTPVAKAFPAVRKKGIREIMK